ncbi:MAG: AAA family ATPase [SAR202 cluster bacterium]|jgi:predicted kinase|nr:AAA family ATPase [SAR202 cluster bacterium]MDP6513662.1 AAA family ATPase [SAR202 cluster bacterium]MDP6716612.1 AAA family ATPase [SAR202 cluster bacterium]
MNPAGAIADRAGEMNRRPLLIVVSGPPAAGKTTIAIDIGTRLGIPVFSKDLIKESLHDSLGWSDLEQSRKFGLASIRLLYKMLDTQLASGHSVIAEMNFYTQYDPPRLLEMATRLSSRLIQVHCYAESDILLTRYKERANTGDRHPAHVDSENVEDLFEKLADGAWAPLDLNAPLIQIDTSDFAAVQVPDLVMRLDELINL